MALTDHWNSQLQAFLDGLLSSEQLCSFNERLMQDPELKAALDQHRVIDQSLRRVMVDPSPARAQAVRQYIQAAALAAGTGATSNGLAGKTALAGTNGVLNPAADNLKLVQSAAALRTSGSLRRRLAIAAMIIAALFIGWSGWNYFKGDSSNNLPLLTVDQYHQLVVAKNWHPYWKCENNEQFASAFRKRLGQPLLLGALPANIEAHGLDYANTLSKKTMALLAHVDDQGVIVLIDRHDSSKHPPQLTDPSLHIYQRTVGKLDLYEVSPLTEPKLLDLFYDPDVQKSAGPDGKWH